MDTPATIGSHAFRGMAGADRVSGAGEYPGAGTRTAMGGRNSCAGDDRFLLMALQYHEELEKPTIGKEKSRVQAAALMLIDGEKLAREELCRSVSRQK